jgi:hypothetical protein
VAQIHDLIRFRLQRETESHPNPAMQAAGRDLMLLYDAGALDVTFQSGDLMLALTPAAQEALSEGGLCEMLTAYEQGSDV